MKSIPCLICRGPVNLTLHTRKKPGKPFLMLLCQIDSRHYRAFINDEAYVRNIAATLREVKS